MLSIFVLLSVSQDEVIYRAESKNGNVVLVPNYRISKPSIPRQSEENSIRHSDSYDPFIHPGRPGRPPRGSGAGGVLKNEEENKLIVIGPSKPRKGSGVSSRLAEEENKLYVFGPSRPRKGAGISSRFANEDEEYNYVKLVDNNFVLNPSRPRGPRTAEENKWFWTKSQPIIIGRDTSRPKAGGLRMAEENDYYVHDTSRPPSGGTRTAEEENRIAKDTSKSRKGGTRMAEENDYYVHDTSRPSRGGTRTAEEENRIARDTSRARKGGTRTAEENDYYVHDTSRPPSSGTRTAEEENYIVKDTSKSRKGGTRMAEENDYYVHDTSRPSRGGTRTAEENSKVHVSLPKDTSQRASEENSDYAHDTSRSSGTRHAEEENSEYAHDTSRSSGSRHAEEENKFTTISFTSRPSKYSVRYIEEENYDGKKIVSKPRPARPLDSNSALHAHHISSPGGIGPRPGKIIGSIKAEENHLLIGTRISRPLISRLAEENPKSPEK